MPTALLPLQETSGDAGAQYAVVAVNNDGLRATADAVLCAAGLAPVHARDEYEALRAISELDVVLGIIDADMLASARPEQFRRLRQEPSVAGLPVILLSGDAELDIERMVQLSITHFVGGNVEGTDLANRVSLILAGTRATRRRKIAAARLRDKARAVSAALRGTNDPQQMAALAVQGLGETFGACHVRIETFPDERVPELTASWSLADDAAGLPSLPLAEAKTLSTSLCERDDILRVEDHSSPDDPDRAVFPAGVPAQLRTSVFAPLAHGDQVLGYVWIAGTAGARRWSRTELSLIQHVCGNLAHCLVQGHVITAQREVLSRLRELDQAKTDFVATVNHELRTPLTSITGYLELILDGSGGEIPPRMRKMLEIVGRNATRLDQLISDLLTISRTDAHAGLAVEELDLGELLETVAASLAPAAAASEITLQLGPVPAPLLVDGDKAQLEQVFTNLLSNAVKFTLPGGTVDVLSAVVSTDAGAQVRVQVADSGIGIPEADIPKLFRRFFRASNATSAAIPGTGLGLAIVQDIVLQHGGELDIDSTVGCGTTVTVHIPAR
ncbi:GAF domain-containing sensor histidine kinase [Arthrobacter gengyunqii]|uniref:histidine kinase n=1 Tax=Arthrobacter gengyunqii TaxID=2886940 RepID=A0A9X1S6L8_9MICC|nr:ATP-binding protein [Arthrobacter gengyunqii]MCC3270700.1 GAF domain-containing sensor histidine kinase [Arthrobacter gengyunqii]UOY96686.1 GAF domain-containing sensor histidine kinase [Arthrobacter gengyunqii]